MTTSPVGAGSVVKQAKELHEGDDVDKDSLAHHHTLGWGTTQAAPGAETKRLIDEIPPPVPVPPVEWGAATPSANQILTGTIAIVKVAAANFRGLGCTFVSGGALDGTIQVSKAGTYHITGTVCTNQASGVAGWAIVGVAIYRGGTYLREFDAIGTTAGAGGYNEMSVAQTVDLLADDSVGLIGLSNVGTVVTDKDRTHLTVHLIAGGGSAGAVGPQGPQGPQGPIGPSGGASSGYMHTQGAVSSTWVIVHNMGFRPNVYVEDSGGNDVEGDVTHDSTNQMTINFSAAFSGVAYLS